MSEDVARFYGAEIILGLEHLHKLNIVYRDLKVSVSMVTQIMLIPVVL